MASICAPLRALATLLNRYHTFAQRRVAATTMTTGARGVARPETLQTSFVLHISANAVDGAMSVEMHPVLPTAPGHRLPTRAKASRTLASVLCFYDCTHRLRHSPRNWKKRSHAATVRLPQQPCYQRGAPGRRIAALLAGAPGAAVTAIAILCVRRCARTTCVRACTNTRIHVRREGSGTHLRNNQIWRSPLKFTEKVQF